MTDSSAEKPARRPRYSGTHPRRFHEKYKERQPDQYPADVAKVLDAGKTPAGTHRPIMVAEVLEALALKPGDVAVDGTLGYGGHAREMLRVIQPGGRLLGFDLDSVELPKTEARLHEAGLDASSLKVWRHNFAGVATILAEEAPGGVDAIFADLGVSSMQLDDPARGFSFKVDGPLDMRMNPLHGPTAAELLSRLTPKKLAKLLTENSDEPLSRVLAEAILRKHAGQPLKTTHALADLIRQTAAQVSRHADAEGAVRRVFQALRIAVNDEFRALEAFLRQLPMCLKPGGRAAFLTFHSGEDRRVKAALKQGFQDGVYAFITKDVMQATMEEQRSNPRSSSAKLRYAIRGAL